MLILKECVYMKSLRLSICINYHKIREYVFLVKISHNSKSAIPSHLLNPDAHHTFTVGTFFWELKANQTPTANFHSFLFINNSSIMLSTNTRSYSHLNTRYTDSPLLVALLSLHYGNIKRAKIKKTGTFVLFCWKKTNKTTHGSNNSSTIPSHNRNKWRTEYEHNDKTGAVVFLGFGSSSCIIRLPGVENF